jgi:DNA-binding beta-propeller fold protein YncE
VIEVKPDGSKRTVAAGLSSIFQLANDPDTNDLYVTSYLGKLVKVNPDTGATEDMATGLNYPIGCALAGDFVFVTTRNDNMLRAVNKRTKKVEDICSIPVQYSWGITLEPSGLYAYIGNTGSELIRVNLKDRTIDKKFGGFNQPMVALAEDDGHLLVSDYGSQRVVRLDLNSGAVTAVSTPGGGTAQIERDDRPYPKYPTQFAPSVADVWFTQSPMRVFALDTRRGVASQIANDGGRGTQGMCLGLDGAIYYETGSSAISRLDVDSGQSKVIANGLTYPSGIFPDPDTGDLYVGEYTTGRILRINATTGAQTVLRAGGGSTFSVALVGDVLFFGEYGEGKVHAMWLKEGNRIEDFATLPSGWARRMTPSLKGDKLFVSCVDPGAGLIQCIDLATRKVTKTYNVSRALGMVAEEDGKLLVSVEHGIVHLDPETGATTPVLDGTSTNGEAIWLRGAEKRKYPTPPKIVDDIYFNYDAGPGSSAVYSAISLTGASKQLAAWGYAYPMSLCMGRDGAVYAGHHPRSSFSGGVVTRIDPDTGATKDVVTGVCHPAGLFADPGSDDIFVAEELGMDGHPASIWRANTVTGEKTLVCTPPQFNVPGGYPGTTARGLVLLGDVLLFVERCGDPKIWAIWLKEGNRLETFMTLPQPAMVLTPNVKGDELFACNWDSGNIWRIDVAKRAVVKTYNIPNAQGLSVQDDGKVLVGAWTSGVVRLDPDTGATTPVIAGPRATDVWLRGVEKRRYPTPAKIARDVYFNYFKGAAGPSAVFGGSSALATSTQLAAFGDDNPTSVVVGLDGAVYVGHQPSNDSWNSLGTVSRVDPDSGRTTDVLKGLRYPYGLFADPASGDLFVAEHFQPSRILRFNATTGAQTVVATPPIFVWNPGDIPGSRVTSLALVGDVLLYVQGREAWISAIWLKEGNRLEKFMTLPSHGQQIVPSLKGDEVYVNNEAGDTVWRCNLATRQIVKTYPVPASCGLAVDDGGKILVAAWAKGVVRLDPDTGAITPVIPGPDASYMWLKGAEKRQYPTPAKIKEWRYDFSSATQMADWQAINGTWQIQGGTLVQTNPAPATDWPSYYLVKHVPSTGVRRFTFEAKWCATAAYAAGGCGHAGIIWSYVRPAWFSLLYMHSTTIFDIETCSTQGSTGTGQGPWSGVKAWPFNGQIGTWYDVRVDIDLDQQTGRLFVDGKQIDTWGAPYVNPADGPLGFWTCNHSAYKDVWIRAYDPGEAFAPQG